MGNVDWLAVVLGAVAFFAVGAVWYGALFNKSWPRAAGVKNAPSSQAAAAAMVVTFLLELLIAATLGHQYAMTAPSDRAKMMIAIGYGVALIAPAIGINYLHQRRPFWLFAIDAGYFVVGMAAMGGVFALLD